MTRRSGIISARSLGVPFDYQSALTGERDASEGLNQIAANHFSVKPQHAVPVPLKHPVPPRVSRDTQRMVTPVHFHHEASRGSEEVNHETVNDHLTLERNPKPFARKAKPQDLLRVRYIVPHDLSALRQQRLKLRVVDVIACA